MKIGTWILVATLVAHLLAPLPCAARQSAEGNISQLREQIARLEKIDGDPDTSLEVRALNRGFLKERRAQLHSLVSRRISALRQYLSTVGDTLKPQERQAVENSIQALTEELRRAEPEAERSPATIARTRSDLPADTVVKSQYPSGGEAIYRGSLIPPAPYLPPAHSYLPASEVAPNPVRQNGRRVGAPSGGDENDGNSVIINTVPPPTAIPTPLEVENKSVVTVRGTESLVNTCVVATKREELKPEPSPFAQIIKVLFGLGPIPLGKLVAAPSCSPAPAPEAIPDNPEARRIEDDLTALRRSLVANVTAVNELTKPYSDVADDISAFSNCQAIRVKPDGTKDLDANGKYQYDGICTTPDDYEQVQKPKIRGKVESVLEKEFLIIKSTELQMTALEKAITGYKEKGALVAGEADWIKSVHDRLNCNARTLEQVRTERASLQSSRAEFESFLKLLDRHKPDGFYEKKLIIDSNAKVTGTVTCTNVFTKQPAFDPIPFTVTYRAFSPHSLSGGILISTLNKRQVGIQPVRTGTNADGSSIVRLTFAETDKADAQIIPFTFYNYRFFGNRKFSLNGSGGVGVNPNNGAAQVEFFFGGSVGINNVFLQFGGHAGRWQDLGGGFAIGDILAAPPPAVPIERRYTIRPSFGVSYKLPLP